MPVCRMVKGVSFWCTWHFQCFFKIQILKAVGETAIFASFHDAGWRNQTRVVTSATGTPCSQVQKQSSEGDVFFSKLCCVEILALFVTCQFYLFGYVVLFVWFLNVILAHSWYDSLKRCFPFACCTMMKVLFQWFLTEGNICPDWIAESSGGRARAQEGRSDSSYGLLPKFRNRLTVFAKKHSVLVFHKSSAGVVLGCWWPCGWYRCEPQ